jgi:hypothetical protein
LTKCLKKITLSNMTKEEIVRVLRINQAARLSLTEIARRAGVSRETLRTVIRSGRLTESVRTRVEHALQTAQRDGYHIPRSIAS